MAGHIGGDEFVVYLPLNAKDARVFMGNVFGTMRKWELRDLKRHPKVTAHNTRVVTNNPKTRNKLTLTYSAGIIGIPKGAEINQVEHAGDLLCKMAKRQSRDRPSYSVRSDLGRFERELHKKGIKL